MLQYAPCALTSVQLLASDKETRRAGLDAVRRTACICLRFTTFETLQFGNCSYLLILKAIFLNVLILVVSV